MSIELRPPRPGRPFYTGRGTYLGVYVDRSTKTNDKRIAKQIIARWKRAIERGEYRDPRQAPTPKPRALTFLDAAVAYMQAGGETRFMEPIIEHTGPLALRNRALDSITQIDLDLTAADLYPNAGPATRNRNFYTPALAVIHRGGIEKQFLRPKGWRGNKSTSWLEPDQAFRLFAAADRLDLEFGLFLRTLLYTGMRLGDALGLRLAQLNLKRSFIYLPRTKNEEPRAVYVPPTLAKAFRQQPPRPRRGAEIARTRRQLGRDIGGSQADAGVPFLKRDPQARLFRFHASGALRKKLARAMAAAGLKFPRRQGGFHIFCHTYGTWMKRFGGLDTYGLTRTDRWIDPRSADRYNHSEVSEESRRADRLPVERKRRAAR